MFYRSNMDVDKVHIIIGKDHGSPKMFIPLLYFPTLNINTYNYILGTRCLSLFCNGLM
jgi:hypothetical protein